MDDLIRRTIGPAIAVEVVGAGGLWLTKVDQAQLESVLLNMAINTRADAARITRPNLKVLFVTGYAENAVVGNGHLDAGMQVITRPFAMSDLTAKVRDMIDR